MAEIDPALLAQLQKEDTEALRDLVRQNVEVQEAVFFAHPEFAEDAQFSPFSGDWFRRYARSLAKEVSGKPLDQALKWALAGTAVQVSATLVERYGITAASYPAAVALAILLIRAAQNIEKD